MDLVRGLRRSLAVGGLAGVAVHLDAVAAAPRVRPTKGGSLRVDQTAVAAEAKLDGKYLLRTSDPSRTAEDIALGYKQLAEVEAGWREMKHTLDLRPVYRRLESAWSC